MMVSTSTVKAQLGTEKFYTVVTAGKNQLITDEPIEKGGQNKGFNPHEILATSLASCTAATLRMYIDRKGWDIPKIVVGVQIETYPQTQTSVFQRDVCFEEAILDEDQMKRLRAIAEACPIHKLLLGTIEINTKL